MLEWNHSELTNLLHDSNFAISISIIHKYTHGYCSDTVQQTLQTNSAADKISGIKKNPGDTSLNEERSHPANFHHYRVYRSLRLGRSGKIT